MKNLIRYTCLFLCILLLVPATLAQDEGPEDEEVIAIYEVAPDGSLYLIQGEELDEHYKVWDLILNLTPRDYLLLQVHQYRVFDALDTTGSVFDYAENDWEFSIDTDPEEGLEYIPYTVIHEFAHILSFDTNTYVAFSEDEDLQDAIESCSGSVVFEGCLMPGAYMDLFISEFYDIDSEAYQNFLYGDDPDGLIELFDLDPDAYVTEYAASNPDEDFAESFAHFVILSEEQAQTFPYGQEKILWFYSQPDLVDLRNQILDTAFANKIGLYIPEEE